MSYYNKEPSPYQYSNPTMQQPAAVGQPAVVVNQPTHSAVVTEMPEKDWNSGLCGCCEDVTSCLCVWCCGPCYLCCSLSPRMGEHCCTPVCLSCVDPSGSVLTVLIYRTKLRAKYNIRGSAINDCCCTVCCGALVACQVKRELDHLESTLGRPPF